MSFRNSKGQYTKDTLINRLCSVYYKIFARLDGWLMQKKSQ